MAGIYIHIPFCAQACHYCDFHFSTSTRLQAPMVTALRNELRLRQCYLEETVSSIYLGGGTPSLLSPEQLQGLLDDCKATFAVSKEAEVTLEANPDDISDQSITFWKAAGVNRLSVGIQTFDADLLRFMNRSHSAEEAMRSLELIANAGFESWTMDLIYGIHRQSDALWEEDLVMAMQYAPPHISSYCLTLEPKTAFGKWLKQGRLQDVNEEQANRQYHRLCEVLARNGYDHYEVSNFGKPGHYSRHNTSYWLQEPYLGIGPSAHSYNRSSRQYNVSSNPAYLKAIDAGRVPAKVEELSKTDHFNEYMMVSLRTRWGVDLHKVRRDFGVNLAEDFGSQLHDLEERGLGKVEGNRLILTDQGRLFADGIALQFFIDA